MALFHCPPGIVDVQGASPRPPRAQACRPPRRAGRREKQKMEAETDYGQGEFRMIAGKTPLLDRLSSVRKRAESGKRRAAGADEADRRRRISGPAPRAPRPMTGPGCPDISGQGESV